MANPSIFSLAGPTAPGATLPSAGQTTQATAQPAFFSNLLERGKKRQSSALADGDGDSVEIPNLQLGINGLRALAQGLSGHEQDELQSRIIERKGLSALAASGIPTSTVRTKLATLDTRGKGRTTGRHPVEAFDPDNQRFLRQMQQRGKDAITADSLARARSQYTAFLDNGVALDWKEHRDRMLERLGYGTKASATSAAQAVPAGSGADARSVEKTKTMPYPAASTIGVDSRGSVLARSSFKKSVIGSPATDLRAMYGFGEPSGTRDEAFPVNVRALRDKMGRFATVVRRLNNARMEDCSFPILHEARDVEKSSKDTPRQLIDAYDALIRIVDEPLSQEELTAEFGDLARDYAHDVATSKEAVRMRRRIVDGSRAFLEERFRSQVDQVVASDPAEAQVGGIPSVLNKVRAYVRLRDARKDLAPHNIEMQKVGSDLCWVVIFYLIRCGYLEEAVDYISSNVGFRSMDHKFATYMAAYARDRRIPREMAAKLHVEYQQRLRNAPEIDPYRMACYKIVGRCDPSQRRFDGITQGIEDWIWLQFVFAREETRPEDASAEAFGLQEIQKDFTNIGQRMFADADGDYAIYFLLQILGGMFEQAVAYLGRYEPVSAVHYAIALRYHGLLRVSDFYTTDEILSYTTSEYPQLNFASIVAQYTRDFRAGDVEAAIDYFSLICLNADSRGEIGRSQLTVCHEALREFILESREFTKLLGDIRSDGTRIKGAIEQRSKLYGVHNDTEFFKTITLQAAAVAADKGLITDAARLYHLAEEYDRVLCLLAQTLSEAIVSEAAAYAPALQKGEESDATDIEPVALASHMVKLYDGSAMYFSKIKPENLRSCILLLNACDAQKMMAQSQWTRALDIINELQILPLTADGSVSYIKTAVQAFQALPPVVSRIVGQLIMWSIHCLARERERLQQNLFENDMRVTMSEHYLSMAKDLMTFAGMVRYKLSPRLYQALARAAGDIGA
ncbi:hypothetical protein KEM52_003699 [Ascosphaera acerosa]|nr:hypothetical protein KEM52_003699 [Ascosphaera acerosa]